MSASSDARLLAVVGPTGAGKTELAESLAVQLGGEIISADSMQVYRGMDLGTAKPARPHAVHYHCLDLVDPGETYSAALFQRDARTAIDGILGRGRTPILAGGTGLYVRSALDDWVIPKGHADTDARRRLEADLARHGPQYMHDRLAALDPKAAALIHPNNARRVLRALEMHQHGVSYAESADRFQKRQSVYDARFLGLTMDRELLYARIDSRVDRMLEDGLLEEVRRLLDRGFREALTAAQAIGYKELVPVLESGADLQSAVTAIKQATRRYAKRQMTWFRADPRIRWLDVTEMSRSETSERAVGLLSSD